MLAPPPLERRRSQDELQIQNDYKRHPFIYVPILPVYGKGEAREEELSDGFSESNSLNSDILDSAKLKDLI